MTDQMVLLAGPTAVVVTLWLWSRPRPVRLRSGRRQAGSPIWLGVALAVGTSALLRSPTAWSAAAFLYWFIRIERRKAIRRRDADHLEAGLVSVADELSQQLRAGAAVAPAFVAAVRANTFVSSRLAAVLRAAEAGVRLDVALENADHNPSDHSAADHNPADHSASDSLRLFAAALTILIRSGGPAAPAIERLSEALREKRAARRELLAQASQARASAMVLGCLPLLFAGVVAWVEPAAAAFYLHSLAGGVCVLVMLALIAVCWWWIDAVVWVRP